MAKKKRHSGLEDCVPLDLAAYNKLSAKEQADGNLMMVHGRVVCLACVARRMNAKARTRRWRERKRVVSNG